MTINLSNISMNNTNSLCNGIKLKHHGNALIKEKGPGWGYYFWF